MIHERLARIRPAWILAAIIIVSSAATLLAMRRTSTTFDEIVLIAAGARGIETGKFDLAPEHPPLMQYVYGLPVYLSRPNYPSEVGANTKAFVYRYIYARQFFWESGNDGLKATFLGRLPAVLCALLLVLATFLFARRVMGDHAALLAATLVAFLPDMLAHGGVAYNDVPLALAYFLALWALDAVMRDPTWKRAVVAGAAIALAFGAKFSAVAIGPAAFALLFLEVVQRGRDVRWIVRIVPAAVVTLIATYFCLVIIYRGDFALVEFRYGLDYTFRHVSKGHGAAGFLLGESSATGFWYFFPVAFLYKTSVALHALAIIALWALLKVDFPPLRALAGSRLRMPVVAAAVFGLALTTSSLNIGFRYALPMLPFLCVLIAAGVEYMWRVSGQRLRAAVGVLVAWAVIAPLTFYPNFLAYISEYGPGRGRGSEVLIDSSLDWGQGLIQLRDYMRKHGIERVYLSYFGSAMPDGYGIDYEPLASFFALGPSRAARPGAPQPKFVVVSATNLQGAYLPGDPYARFRKMEPDAVIAGTMYLYRIQD